MNEDRLPADVRREKFLSGVRLVAPVSLFIAVYIGTFVVAGSGAVAAGLRATYPIALASAAFATWLTVRIVEQGRWRIGFFVESRFVVIEGALGVAVAAAVIGAADAIIIATTGLHHVAGGGFAWRELLVIYIPAAIHEELLFRGYLFQRIRAWNRPAAIILTSAAFSALHAGNGGVTAIAFANLALAGILLALAYERYERLWFPIGLHLAWNVLSGPVLGYDVSGYQSIATVLRTVGSGPQWATGGSFGIEGSAWMLPVELVAIAILWRTQARRRAFRDDSAS